MSESSTRIGVYPGTFDPITLGHMDLIQRSLRVVDHLVVAVAANDLKGPLFSVEERLAMVRADVASNPNLNGRVEVKAFSTLLMNFVVEQQAAVIVRGLRAVSDFEYEFQMTGMNAKLNPAIETVFLMAAEGVQCISSRFVKEIARLDGDVSRFISPVVQEALQAKLKG